MTLSDWFDRPDACSRADFADILGISRGHVTDLCKGRNKPGLAMAFRIERLTAGMVPAASWVTEEEIRTNGK